MRERIKKNSNDIIIEVDCLPEKINPFSKDYSSLFICSVIYEPLKDGENCSITKYKNYYIINLFENYLGSSKEIINCLKFHLNSDNKSIYATQLLAIKNSIDFFKKKSYAKLGTYSLGTKTLLIELNYESSIFYSVIQSLYIIPMINNLPIPNGPYELHEITDSFVQVKRNNCYNSMIHHSVEEITFKLNTNPYRSIDLYLKGEIDISCHTQHMHQNNYLKEFEDFIVHQSDMLYVLHVSNSRLKNIINQMELKKHIETRLDYIVTPLDSLTGDEYYINKNLKSEANNEDNEQAEEIQIIYSNYYPNEIIIDEIVDLLSKKGYKCEVEVVNGFNEYLKIDKEKYHISLHLVFPIYSHWSSYVKFFLNDIKDVLRKEEIIKRINNNDLEGLNILMNSSDHYVPFLKGKLMYLKDPLIKGYTLNSNGLLSVESLRKKIKCK